MNVPTVEIHWVPDVPKTLVCVFLRVGEDEANTRVGTGSTLVEAFERLTAHMRQCAERDDDNRMREILGVADPMKVYAKIVDGEVVDVVASSEEPS